MLPRSVTRPLPRNDNAPHISAFGGKADIRDEAKFRIPGAC